VTWLLDTSTIVDALRRNDTVRGRLAAVSPDELVIPSIAVAELAFGAEKSADPRRARVVWQEFVEPFVVVPFDRAAAAEHGRLRFGLRAMPIGERDLLIAATAVAHSLTVVTKNTREFLRVPGLSVEDWSTA
jgi:tRNA(fMet)-specific endonuclease VapC